MHITARPTIHEKPTPYADLNDLLRELVLRVQSVLADDFIGAYLQGSFAVGDFDIYSDVDFLIVLREDVSELDLPKLQSLHREVYDLRSPWARHLEGSYIPIGALGRFPPPARGFLYLDHGSRELVRSEHDDSLVVYWILQEKGVTLIGPEARSLVAPVPVQALRREILETMRAWQEDLLADPGKLNSRWYQTFAVLSYCRMLHSLRTGTIESKRAGAAWAK